MGKEDFKTYICRPFCMFFREGQKEDLTCQGARVISQLVKVRKLNPHRLPCNGKNSGLWKEPDPILDSIVCRRCSFEKEDCDFRSNDPPSDSEPCGGYILLRLLIKKGIISSLDLEEFAFE
jgi:hypothetical protein